MQEGDALLSKGCPPLMAGVPPEIWVSPKGSILFITLWSLCLLTVFAVHLGYGIRQKIVLIERLNSRDSLYFIADAGVKQGIAELRRKTQEEDEYYCLNEAWSNNPGIFKQVGVGLGEFSVGYKYLNYQSGQEETRYGIIDEERKLNLNKADLDIIRRLIMSLVDLEETEAQGLAAAIVDWRDSDSSPSIPGSAEDGYYRSLPIPYEAKDAALEVFDELLLLKGMSQEILNKLEDYITIYSNGKININTASPAVLLALGLEHKLADKIMSFRCGEDEVEATPDDNIFSSPASIVQQLDGFSELSSGESAALGNLVSRGAISTGSSNFMVRSEATLGKRNLQVICIVNQEGEILSWKEG